MHFVVWWAIIVHLHEKEISEWNKLLPLLVVKQPLNFGGDNTDRPSQHAPNHSLLRVSFPVDSHNSDHLTRPKSQSSESLFPI